MVRYLKSPNVLTALAVFLGCVLVSIALYYSNVQALAEDVVTLQRSDPDTRHLYGNPNADLVLVEFSDFECPFCAQFHTTLKKLIDESGGTLAWEYRHLPLQIHPVAVPAAVAAECVAARKGDESFWQFSDILFTNQKNLSEEMVAKEALALGITADELAVCSSNPKIKKLIEDDMQAAKTLGGSGTPFSVLLLPDNSYKVIPGALPYDKLKTLIDQYAQ